jgi:hypothetical protein
MFAVYRLSAEPLKSLRVHSRRREDFRRMLYIILFLLGILVGLVLRDLTVTSPSKPVWKTFPLTPKDGVK